MHKNNYINFAGLALLFGLLFSACSEDFLDRPVKDALTEDTFFSSREDLRAATAPLYTQVWFSFNGTANFALGEALGGNVFAYNNNRNFVEFRHNANSADLREAWQAFYRVIAQSNHVINNIHKHGGQVAETDRNAAVAEARFMRGVAYLYLVKLWGPVILSEDQVELAADAKRAPHKVEDVYTFILRDLLFASEHLPESDDPGRLTTWAAQGMLARVYLSRAGLNGEGSRNEADLSQARFYAERVIKDSGLELYPDYDQLFYLSANNNPESLFALQWFPTTTWGSTNTVQAYLAPDGRITGVGDGWGQGTFPSHHLISEFLSDPKDSLRRKASIMIDQSHYPQLLRKEGGYTYQGSTGGWKKYIIGSPDDNDGQVAFMSAPINTYMLRLAEVYLIYADAIRGNQERTSDTEALHYFNAVRLRAGVDPVNEIDQASMLRELRLELAGESQFWYYLVNWFYYQPDQALAYINAQHRGELYSYKSGFGFEWMAPASVPVVATAADMTMPYPESEVQQNPLLNEAPVSYIFE